MADLGARQRAARETRVEPSQKDSGRAKPERLPGARYTTQSDGNAIAEARKRAGVEPWHPPSCGSRPPPRAAPVVLGHFQANGTGVYAERDLALTARVAGEIG